MSLGCPDHEECVGVEGSRTCECVKGRERDGTGLCIDVNECSSEAHTCDTNAACANLDGSFECTCNNGWSADVGSEWLIESRTEPSSRWCSIRCDGQAECTAFNFDSTTGECELLQSCMALDSGASSTTVGYRYESCSDNPLDHFDEPISGRSWQSSVTTIHQERLLSGDISDCARMCIDNGSACESFEFRESTRMCVLRSRSPTAGYNENTAWQAFARLYVCDTSGNAYVSLGQKCGQPPLDGTQCINVDECTKGASPCDANAACFDSVGSYSCECNSGWSGSGSVCSNVDECLAALHSCTPQEACFDTNGSFLCTTHEPTTTPTMHPTMSLTTSSPTHTPTVRPASDPTIVSLCVSGRTDDGLGGCTDVNECLSGNHNCDSNAHCTNIDGSFQCECKSGYISQIASIVNTTVSNPKWCGIRCDQNKNLGCTAFSFHAESGMCELTKRCHTTIPTTGYAVFKYDTCASDPLEHFFVAGSGRSWARSTTTLDEVVLESFNATECARRCLEYGVDCRSFEVHSTNTRCSLRSRVPSDGLTENVKWTSYERSYVCDETNHAYIPEGNDRQCNVAISDGLECANVDECEGGADSCEAGATCIDTVGSFLCEIPPSSLPTLSPTAIPTIDPTHFPTTRPTGRPTNDPTDAPTHLPTSTVPTGSPTDTPSQTPTEIPTHSPTVRPTERPTQSPTVSPTQHPTLHPTGSPQTSTPTGAPSSQPTMPPTTLSPTNQPTIQPSHLPTNPPTKLPTLEPTFYPTTLKPTSRPSTVPTNFPTLEPTDSPSYQPTSAPNTQSPSSSPTQLPSPDPTLTPSLRPTLRPSEPPTRISTGTPTQESQSPTNGHSQPTIRPTEVPTAKPTVEPTREPTPSPSRAPTEYPSQNPTVAPSNVDTLSPSTNVPTTAPTDNPSQPPTHVPSTFPTNFPTGMPSLDPTQLRTETPTTIPTEHPSQSPTSIVPSSTPTMPPSSRPTMSPSRSPTARPSSLPSLPPTSLPTERPSQSPTSIAPSGTPTLSPSTTPTFSPSDSPTTSPSFTPTKEPSVLPSNNPTAQPSEVSSPSGPDLCATDPLRRFVRTENVRMLNSQIGILSTVIMNSEEECAQHCATFNPACLAVEVRPQADGNVKCVLKEFNDRSFKLTVGWNSLIRNDSLCFSTSSEPHTHDPTPTPTASPTSLEPSSIPALEPTNRPSEEPTVLPSVAPTLSPVAVPTLAPTQLPTSSPTVVPTPYPTHAPSNSPSQHPTQQPSSEPTRSPTDAPTEYPTYVPTQTPTKTPTDSPTDQPSHSPSFHPSMIPSSTPSDAPTLLPTREPSQTPTVSPSTSPTTKPSHIPTRQPSPSPTPRPTTHPTASPSENPTEQPTHVPSFAPTNFPTGAPSPHPSSTPTREPTQIPTRLPSSPEPTLTPTSQPSETALDRKNCEGQPLLRFSEKPLRRMMNVNQGILIQHSSIATVSKCAELCIEHGDSCKAFEIRSDGSSNLCNLKSFNDRALRENSFWSTYLRDDQLCNELPQDSTITSTTAVVTEVTTSTTCDLASSPFFSTVTSARSASSSSSQIRGLTVSSAQQCAQECVNHGVDCAAFELRDDTNGVFRCNLKDTGARGESVSAAGRWSFHVRVQGGFCTGPAVVIGEEEATTVEISTSVASTDIPMTTSTSRTAQSTTKTTTVQAPTRCPDDTLDMFSKRLAQRMINANQGILVNERVVDAAACAVLCVAHGLDCVAFEHQVIESKLDRCILKSFNDRDLRETTQWNTYLRIIGACERHSEPSTTPESSTITTTTNLPTTTPAPEETTSEVPCVNRVGWVDSDGKGCIHYFLNRWCTVTGSFGPGWGGRLPSFSAYAVDGIDATMACCVCGKGTVPTPSPTSEVVSSTGTTTTVTETTFTITATTTIVTETTASTTTSTVTELEEATSLSTTVGVSTTQSCVADPMQGCSSSKPCCAHLPLACLPALVNGVIVPSCLVQAAGSGGCYTDGDLCTQDSHCCSRACNSATYRCDPGAASTVTTRTTTSTTVEHVCVSEPMHLCSVSSPCCSDLPLACLPTIMDGKVVPACVVQAAGNGACYDKNALCTQDSHCCSRNCNRAIFRCGESITAAPQTRSPTRVPTKAPTRVPTRVPSRAATLEFLAQPTILKSDTQTLSTTVSYSTPTIDNAHLIVKVKDGAILIGKAKYSLENESGSVNVAVSLDVTLIPSPGGHVNLLIYLTPRGTAAWGARLTQASALMIVATGSPVAPTAPPTSLPASQSCAGACYQFVSRTYPDGSACFCDVLCQMQGTCCLDFGQECLGQDPSASTAPTHEVSASGGPTPSLSCQSALFGSCSGRTCCGNMVCIPAASGPHCSVLEPQGNECYADTLYCLRDDQCCSGVCTSTVCSNSQNTPTSTPHVPPSDNPTSTVEPETTGPTTSVVHETTETSTSCQSLPFTPCLGSVCCPETGMICLPHGSSLTPTCIVLGPQAGSCFDGGQLCTSNAHCCSGSCDLDQYVCTADERRVSRSVSSPDPASNDSTQTSIGIMGLSLFGIIVFVVLAVTLVKRFSSTRRAEIGQVSEPTPIAAHRTSNRGSAVNLA